MAVSSDQDPYTSIFVLDSFILIKGSFLRNENCFDLIFVISVVFSVRAIMFIFHNRLCHHFYEFKQRILSHKKVQDTSKSVNNYCTCCNSLDRESIYLSLRNYIVGQVIFLVLYMGAYGLKRNQVICSLTTVIFINFFHI